MRVTHFRARIYVCVSQKGCILIRSLRPFRGSNPPGCDFPPLVLRGWGDRHCWGQLSLSRWGNNATVSSLSLPPSLFSSPHLQLTFLDILIKVWVRACWLCCHVNLSPYGERSHLVSVMGTVPGVMLLHVYRGKTQVQSRKNTNQMSFLNLFLIFLEFSCKKKTRVVFLPHKSDIFLVTVFCSLWVHKMKVLSFVFSIRGNLILF